MVTEEGPRRRPHRRRLSSVVLAFCSASLLAATPTAALGATQSLQIQAAPKAQATLPETLTATGQVGLQSTVAIYAQVGGGICAPQAAEEAGRGAALVDQRTLAAGPFSFSATFTPMVGGTYFICTYLDGSAKGMTEHQNQSAMLVVAAAPPPATAPARPPTAATSQPGLRCVVPSLKRHTLGRARHLLALGGCKLGRVYRPSLRALRAARRRAGGRTPTQVVVSQTPTAASVRIAGYTVGVRLGFGPTRRRTTTKPTP